jgi:ATP-dependent DNA ligase
MAQRQLATPLAGLKVDWLFRGLCYLDQDRSRFISRNGNALRRFDALSGQVTAVPNVDNAILDGEVIAPDATGRP